MNALVFFDEIFLKGGNRQYFLRILANNISALLPGAKVERAEGGFVVRNVDEHNFLQLGYIPGIAKFSRVYICNNSIEDILKEVSRIQFNDNIKSFRVSASRSYKDYPVSSDDLNCRIGEFLRQNRKWKVDLKNFDIDLHVDITSTSARIFERMQDGVGGLPTGTTGKIMCLISGGIDSPVAAYMSMKRGAEVTLIHFQNKPLNLSYI